MVSSIRLQALVNKRVELELEKVEIDFVVNTLEQDHDTLAFLRERAQTLEHQLEYLDIEIGIAKTNVVPEMSGNMSAMMENMSTEMQIMLQDIEQNLDNLEEDPPGS